MDYCSELRGRVQSGELGWDQANALWRKYADSVAAIWTDQPRPGPCALGAALLPNEGNDPYGACSPDSPTLQDQYFEEFFDEFDPATRFDSCGPAATSSVDNETEAAIQHSPAHISVGRTTLIVAHRLSTIRHAHRIYVMDAGTVSEVGTHEQLVVHDGFYAALWRVQTGEQP